MPDYQEDAPGVWQSRTQFEDQHQGWNTYPEDLQLELQKARNANNNQVRVTVKGNSYVIDFKAKTQHRADDPARVRELRFTKAEGHVWFVLSKSRDSNPRALSRHENARIEQGMAERTVVDGAQCMILEDDNGTPSYIDRVRHRHYEQENDTRWRGVLSLPAQVAGIVTGINEITSGYLRSTSAVYRHLVQAFEDTKGDGNRNLISNDDFNVERIQYFANRKLLLQWHLKLQEFGDQARVVLGFHGTRAHIVDMITEKNFSMKKIGDNTDNEGWFGKGIYFGRRAYTALGYNRSNKLLACMVVVRDVYACLPPNSHNNPMHGKDCKAGYDAHISPTGEELVIFNVRQILPCYVLELNKASEPRPYA